MKHGLAVYNRNENGQLINTTFSLDPFNFILSAKIDKLKEGTVSIPIPLRDALTSVAIVPGYDDIVDLTIDAGGTGTGTTFTIDSYKILADRIEIRVKPTHGVGLHAVVYSIYFYR